MRGFLQRNAFLLRFALLSLFMGISVGLAKFTTTLYVPVFAGVAWLAYRQPLRAQMISA